MGCRRSWVQIPPTRPVSLGCSISRGSSIIWGMDFVTYVLHSETIGRLYIGHSGDFAERFRRHVIGRNPATRGRGPWKTIDTRIFATRSEAMCHERWLKAKKNPTRVLDYVHSQRTDVPDSDSQRVLQACRKVVGSNTDTAALC